MDCPTCEAMVDAYVDGELSATESAAFEAALPGCPDCRRRLEETRAMSGFLRDLPVERAPDLLRAKIERELRAISSASKPQARPFFGQNMRRTAMAASLLVAVGIGWVGASLTGQGKHDGEEAIAPYLRVAMAETPVDVASSDRHTVKPWFAGRIDYAPPVHDLTAEGFPLIGGRLDVVEGRKVAVLVYRRNQHRVALSLWPATVSGNTPPEPVQRDGFAAASWRHAGFELRAASDLAPAEIASFARSVDRAIDADR